MIGNGLAWLIGGVSLLTIMDIVDIRYGAFYIMLLVAMVASPFVAFNLCLTAYLLVMRAASWRLLGRMWLPALACAALMPVYIVISSDELDALDGGTASSDNRADRSGSHLRPALAKEAA